MYAHLDNRHETQYHMDEHISPVYERRKNICIVIDTKQTPRNYMGFGFVRKKLTLTNNYTVTALIVHQEYNYTKLNCTYNYARSC